MKIGVYGGTFNPPHLGHVTAARAVFELLKLDLLLLVPDREPPHKAVNFLFSWVKKIPIVLDSLQNTTHKEKVRSSYS